ncbi:MAG: hypothetical protein AB7U87_02020 [Candidatus Bipolaricaulis sp.]
MCEPHPHARAQAFSHACCESMPHPMRGCCEPMPAPHHGTGCCDPNIGFRRRFVNREEKIAQLEAYLADLRAEAKAVEEKLAKLRRAE